MKHIKLYALIITLLLITFGCEVNTYESNLSNESKVIIEEQNRNEVVNVIDNNEEETEDAIVAEEHSKDSLVGEFGNTPEDIEEMFPGYSYVERDGGELSGYREPNVVVNIGFGQNRNYWAFTNEYGQLKKVIAEEIILQDEETEAVLDSGRYFHDEAKVPGVESSTLDEGHVIADSLGGVANAYNITPQNSTLNRHGDQAYMEKVIRDALYSGMRVTDFEAIITYPDTTTQIPSHYKYTYKINGETIVDEFKNINPDDNAAALEDEKIEGLDTIENISSSDESNVYIESLDKNKEFIVIKNRSNKEFNLSGWKIRSVKGDQIFIFPEHILKPGSSVKVGDSDRNSDVDFHWLDGRGTWNNSDSDPAEIYNSLGELLDRMDN